MLSEETIRMLEPDMVEWRRHFHRHPELSFQEYRTSERIAGLLESWGLEVRRGIAGTGVIGTLRGARPGKTVALRADIDALPIQDQKTCEYASQTPGVMHACGHDGHMAQLLAVARYYSLRREETAGTRVFLFQPAEETLPGGAAAMIREGALDGVAAVFGCHLWTPMPYGMVATRPGPLMASPDEFEIEIAGRGGHAGMPHLSSDALLAGAHLVTSLQTIVSRNVDPLETAVVTVGRFSAGTANNVIAETCRIGGTVRTFTEEARSVVRRRLEEMAAHVCALHGARHEFRYVEGYPPVVNDPRETARFFRVAAALEGGWKVTECDRIMAGEDFSYFLRERPGCYFFVGAGRADGSSAPHHHPLFDIEEKAMFAAARLLIAVADDAAEDAEA